MRFLATITSYLVLAISSTFARLPLPKGYHIVNVIGLGADASKESQGNPNIPLLNATLSCTKIDWPLWKSYDLWGTEWYGVREKSLKHAAANSMTCMTKWKFDASNDTRCYTDADGVKDCMENGPMWHATFPLCKILGQESDDSLLESFMKLTWAYSQRSADKAMWVMSNGTDARLSNLTEAYPHRGIVFERICKWE